MKASYRTFRTAIIISIVVGVAIVAWAWNCMQDQQVLSKKVAFYQIFRNRIEEKQDETDAEKGGAGMSDTRCNIRGKRYACTQLRTLLNEKNQSSPRSDCLDGRSSWGICQHGRFLCSTPGREIKKGRGGVGGRGMETKKGTREGAYATKGRRGVRAQNEIRGNREIQEGQGAVSIQTEHVPLEDLPFGTCVLNGIEYVCSSVQTDLHPLDTCDSDCLDSEASAGMCITGVLCRRQTVCPRSTSQRCIPASDMIVDHQCINGACLVRNVIYDRNWTAPTYGDQLSFGCFAMWSMLDKKFMCSLTTESERSIIPPVLPRACSMLAQLRNGRETMPLRIPALFDPPNSCQRVMSRRAVLIFVDGWNPFHQVLQTFRSLFDALATFTANSGEHHGGQLSDCSIALSPRNSLGDVGPFGRNVLSSFCSHGILELRTLHSVCFSEILLGTTPGGWDMSIQAGDPVRVNFAGIHMVQWIKRSLGVIAGESAKGRTALILRRGRRSILNENDVVSNLSCGSRHEKCNYSIVTIDFDQSSFQESVRLMAKSSVLVGVHGAGLTNLIFMPPGAAVVELRLARSRPDYLHLCRSFGKMHFEFTETGMVLPPSPTNWAIVDDRDLLLRVLSPKSLSLVVSNVSNLVSRQRVACC